MHLLHSQFSTPTLHPLTLIAISSMVGIWYATGTATVLLLILTGTALLALALCATHSHTASLLVLFLVCGAFFIGAGRYAQQQHDFIQTAALFDDGPFDVIARVTDIKETDKGRYSTVVQLQLHKYKQSSRTAVWHKNNTLIVAYCNRAESLQLDDLVYLEECKFTRQKPTSSFSEYLIKEGISATLFCNTLPSTLLRRPQYSLRRMLFTLKTNLFERITKKMSLSAGSFFGSLFLGNRHTHKQYIKEVKTHFNIWGLAHFLARSGLHLVLCMFLWQLILAQFPLPAHYKYFILLVLSSVYLVLSWSSLSFMRAFTLFCLYHVTALWRQQINTVHVITLLTVITLFYNPMQLFFLDFQLSFGLTFALAWLYQTYNWHRVAQPANS